jgi:F-type H+-transporting ATPase subunit c
MRSVNLGAGNGFRVVQREDGISQDARQPPTGGNSYRRNTMRILGTMKYVFMALSVLSVATPLLAQGGATGSFDIVPLAAGFSMAIASGLCALGQGKATAHACEALARNPGARAGIQLALILGLALIESLALYTFVIIFAKVK